MEVCVFIHVVPQVPNLTKHAKVDSGSKPYMEWVANSVTTIQAENKK
jgi:hypothetical protein